MVFQNQNLANVVLNIMLEMMEVVSVGVHHVIAKEISDQFVLVMKVTKCVAVQTAIKLKTITITKPVISD